MDRVDEGFCGWGDPEMCGWGDSDVLGSDTLKRGRPSRKSRRGRKGRRGGKRSHRKGGAKRRSKKRLQR